MNLAQATGCGGRMTLERPMKEGVDGVCDGNANALTSSEVIARLEEAGSTLLALPSSGYSTRLKVSQLEFIREATEVYSADIQRIRPAVPSASQITRMDEALGWTRLIPASRYVLRRIVGARSLINPVTGRHLFSWRKLASVMGADHKAVQRWHAEGIGLVVTALANAGVAMR